MCRAYTEEEVRTQLLDHFRELIRYWHGIDEKSCLERMNGLIFSVLVTFDGGSADLPAFDISPSCEEDDKKYYQEIGSNWYEPKVINECQLHEMWHDEE